MSAGISIDAVNAGIGLASTLLSVLLAVCPLMGRESVVEEVTGRGSSLAKGPATPADGDALAPDALADTADMRRARRAFVGLCVSSAAMAASDALSWIVPLPLDELAMRAIFVGNFVFNAAAAVLFIFYGIYLRATLRMRSRELGRAVRLPLGRVIHVVTVVYLVGCVVSLFNHMFFSVNADTRYYRGELFWLAQTLLVVLYAHTFLTIAVNARLLRRGELVALMSYVLLPGLAELVQVLHFGVALVPVAVSCAIALVLVGVQQRREAESAQADLMIAEESLELMAAQVDPNELYARLDEARDLCLTEPDAAARKIGELSRWLRERMRAMRQET